MAQADAHRGNDRFAAVELVPEPQTPPFLAAPASAAACELARDPGPGAAGCIDVAVEVDLLNGTRVRIGPGASAALLSNVFVALGPR